MGNLKFNRDQFKATRVSQLEEQSKQVDQLTKKSGRAGVLELNRDGSKNRLRIFPKHPGTDSYIFPKTVHFLKVTYTDKDGNPVKDDNGQVKVGKRPIFNSRIHGGTPKDIIDEYINFIYKRAYELYPNDETTRKNYLKTVEGYRSGQSYIPGIKAQTRWVVYGNLNGKFGRVELPTAVKNKLNEIAASQDDEEGAIIVDPFTGIDDGRKVFISYHADEKDPGKKYSAGIDLHKTTPLTDEEFEDFCERQPLQEIYHLAYKRKDFMMAIEGLKTFDEESNKALRALGFNEGYQVFSFDEFLDVCEEIDAYYPEEEEEERENEKAGNQFLKGETQKPKQEEVPFEADVQTQDLRSMSIAQLKAVIKEEGLGIRILPSYTPEIVAQFIEEERAIIAEEKGEEADEQPVAPKRSRLQGLKERAKK